MKRYFQLAVALFLIIFLISTAMSTEIKVSRIGDGYQVWWEAEDFDERDPDKGYKVGTEAEQTNDQITVTEGFYGTDVTMFPENSDRHDLKDWWGLYQINLPSGAQPGTWYFWCRTSFPGAVGDLESHFLWLLSDPDDGTTVSKTRPADEISDDDDRLFGDIPGHDMSIEWKWFGKNSVLEGLDKELQASNNVVMIWERESGFDSTFMDVMVFADDKGYIPKDEDYESATSASAVKPLNKLPLSWGALKWKTK